MSPSLPRLKPAPATPLDADEELLLRCVSAQREAAIALLTQAVEINSGSHNPDGISAVHALLEPALHAAGLRRVRARPSVSSDVPATHRLYRTSSAKLVRGGAPPRVLLLGHVDTVFEPGCGFRRARRQGTRLNGPGAADMKGGVVAAIVALRALHDAPGPPPRLTLLLTGDEEIGAPRSRGLIERLARSHDLGLVLEPGRTDPRGGVLLARAGAAAARLEVRGRAAHSGDRFVEGCSAIDDLARKLVALTSLSDPARGCIVNAGEVECGVGAKRNRVADLAWAELDLRFPDLEAAEQLRGALDQIGLPPLVHNPWTGARTRSTLRWDLHCPPMPYEPRRGKLYQLLAGLAAELGLTLSPTSAMGGSDGNTAAAQGLLLLDGLGPVGGGLHSDEEWVELDSLFDRAGLLAVFLGRLARGAVRLPPPAAQHG